jgi:hypothetical protein
VDVGTALAKAQRLYDLAARYEATNGALTREDLIELTMLYGELEEVIVKYSGGPKRIVVEGHRPNAGVEYPTVFAAGFLSGRTMFTHQGLTELLTVVGKLRRDASDPTGTPTPPASVTQLIQILNRFRECCQYVKAPPSDEREIQDLIWIMLRSTFERVDREDTLPKFGAKTYRPDFGVPDVGVLVEAKYIGSKTTPAAIQEEILADVPGYLRAGSAYKHIIVIVYDAAHKLRDPRKFMEDLRTVDGILDVLVVPGIA